MRHWLPDKRHRGEGGASGTGVDPDTDRLSIAQAKYSARDNATFREGSGECFPDGPYDLVFSNHVVHWIEDKEFTFNNVFRSLRHGGRFSFVCATENKSFIWDLLHPSTKESFHFCQSGDYETLAKKCGFEIVFSAVEPVTYSFDNAEEFILYTYASMNVDRDTEGRTEAFKNRFIGKQVHMDWVRATFILKK